MNIKLIGERCSLIPLKDSDAANWAEWYNDIYISLPESNIYDVQSLNNTQGWVSHNIKNSDYVFTIIENSTNTPIGKIELEIDTISNCGTFGIVVGERNFWGQGFGKEATLLILEFAFNQQNLHNVMLGVYGFNQRAYNLYKLIGFKEIGKQREYQLIGGKRFDMNLMDMLSKEYKEKYCEIL